MTFGEPIINLWQNAADLFEFPLSLPELGQTVNSSQLKGLGLLTTGNENSTSVSKLDFLCVSSHL